MREPSRTWGDVATQADPYPLFEAMRSSSPVHQVRLVDGHDAWLVLGHDAARAALVDGTLSKDMVTALAGNPALVPSRISALAPAIANITRDLLDHLETSGPNTSHGDGLVLRGLSCPRVRLGPASMKPTRRAEGAWS